MNNEDESVTDIYTTDGNSETEVADTPETTAFRAAVKAEHERILREYQIDVPPGRGENDDDDDDLTDAPFNDDIETSSILTDNEILRANLEAEERKIMADFNFEYDLQSLDESLPVTPLRTQGSTALRFHPIARSMSDSDTDEEAAKTTATNRGGGLMSRIISLAAGKAEAAKGKPSMNDTANNGVTPGSTTKTASPSVTERPRRYDGDEPPKAQMFAAVGAGTAPAPPSFIIVGPAGETSEAKNVGFPEPKKSLISRMWSDWLGRAMLILIGVILIAAGVSVGTLVVTSKNRGSSPSGATGTASRPEGTNGSTATTPSQAPHAQSAGVPAPPSLSTGSPAALPTPYYTTIPSAAPFSEPTPGPLVTGMPTRPCEDNSTAVFFVNLVVLEQNCSWLSKNQGAQLRMCNPGFEPYTVCPKTCYTCPGMSRPTPSPTLLKPTTTVPVQGTKRPTSTPVTAQDSDAPSIAPTEKSGAPSSIGPSSVAPTRAWVAPPTLVPALSPTELDMRNVTDLIVRFAVKDTITKLSDSTSSQYLALQWLKRQASSDYFDMDLVQRYSLAVLAYSTGFVTWTNSLDWLDESVATCDWMGIGCDDVGNVASIDLRENNLSGRLSKELAMLSNSLVGLDVGQNDINGDLPKEYGLLSKLETLSMDYNNFDTKLPKEIGRMTNLVTWRFHYNQITGTLPTEVVGLTALRELVFWHNDITGSLPEELCSMNLNDIEYDCREIDGDCYTKCFYQCGGDMEVPC